MDLASTNNSHQHTRAANLLDIIDLDTPIHKPQISQENVTNGCLIDFQDLLSNTKGIF